jgi:hypothetical protein
VNEPLTGELVRSLTDDLPIGAAPVEVTVAGGRRLRRRRQVVAGGMAAVVTAGALAAAGLLPGGAERPDVIVPAPHEIHHAWWADGTLHLSNTTVPVQDVQALVQIPDGVVVLTGQGTVRRIDSDGTDRVVGHWREGALRDDLHPSVRAQDDGKVVWLDGTTTPEYSFVVYDPALDTLVASHPIPTGGFHEAAWLNEFEDGVVVWDSAADGQRAWDIDTDTVTKVGTGATFVVAIENQLWATLWKKGTGTEVLSDGGSLWTRREEPGWFSTDGTRLVTVSWPPQQLRVRDALSGQEVAGAIDLDQDEPILLSVLVTDQQLTYIEASEDLSTPSGTAAPYDMVTCDLATSACTPVIEGADEPPVLPSD